MSIWIDVARTAAGLNVLFLLGLSYLWVRNAYEFRTSYTFGLLLFSVFLLAENVLAFYYYLIDPTLSVWFSTQMPAIAWKATMLLHVLETFGLAVLTWITWQ